MTFKNDEYVKVVGGQFDGVKGKVIREDSNTVSISIDGGGAVKVEKKFVFRN